MSAKPGPACEVCREGESKYSCPRCHVRYCSVKCFKNHKEAICDQLAGPAASPANQAQTASTSTTTARRSADVVEEEGEQRQESDTRYRVTSRQFRALEANEAIRRALTDARLREAIAGIDSARNRERALDQAVSDNPEFSSFVNAMLQTIGVRDIEGNCTLR